MSILAASRYLVVFGVSSGGIRGVIWWYSGRHLVVFGASSGGIWGFGQSVHDVQIIMLPDVLGLYSTGRRLMRGGTALDTRVTCQCIRQLCHLAS